MFRKMRIAPRMAVMIVVGTGIVLGMVVGYNYVSAKGLLEEELRLKAEYMAQATAFRIEVIGRAVEKVVQSAAFMLEESPHDTERIYRLLEVFVKDNDEIFGAAVAPFPIGEVPYVWRGDTAEASFLRSDLQNGGYRYDVRDWFTLPRDLDKPVWTEPYFDEGGGDVLMVTRAAPIRRGDGSNEFAGVVTSDISLEWLSEMLAGLSVGRSGYAFLISSTGRIIAHPVSEFIMKETIFSIAEEQDCSELRRLGQRMIRGESGFKPFTSMATGEESWIAFSPVTSSGWSVGIVFSKDELLSVVLELSHKSAALGVLGFVMLFITAIVIARSITKPLKLLERSTRTLAKGQLDTPLPVVNGEDEVAGLARAFESMRNDLVRYIEDLRSTTAAKERIESEINIAHEIQMSLVPRTFPPFPERKDMEIYALLEPARQIGGDFYDFFLVDGNELCVVIGDVSGKGIPAALFMAVTRTLLRTIWQDERSPALALKRLNNELAQDNDSCMFVTIFCIRINLVTGHCVYANGGHNLPFLLRRGKQPEFIPKGDGTIVGCMPDVSFGEDELTLSPNDAIFLYTDGVTEAMNSQNELTGDAWTMDQVRQCCSFDCKSMVEFMRRALKEHTLDAEQSDDITMTCFRFVGQG